MKNTRRHASLEIIEFAEEMLKQEGKIFNDDKVKYIETEIIADESCRVVFEITKKRCRKPYMVWEVYCNEVKEYTDWDKSNFYYLTQQNELGLYII